MAEFDKTNRGSLSKNKKKENETHSDYNGSINVDGVEFWLNAWIKDGKDGKWMSLQIKKKEKLLDSLTNPPVRVSLLMTTQFHSDRKRNV